MKRLLVISFAVPPTPGSSPGRAWHLARHLPAAGWEAVVLTPRNPRRHLAVEKTREHRDFPIPLRLVSDPAGRSFWLQETEYRDSLASKRKSRRHSDEGLALPGLYGKEILTAEEAALEPATEGGRRLLNPVAAFRANPDPRAGWIRPAIEAARAVCEALKPEAVYSISPPVSAHAIAKPVAASAGIPWVADLREPWGGAAARWLDPLNRARILRSASPISVPPSYDPLDAPRRETGSVGAQTSPDAAGVTAAVGAPAPVLVHAGPTSTRGRDPVPLIETIRLLSESESVRHRGLRLRLLGARDPRAVRAIGERSLGRYVTVEPTAPWTVSMETQASADALLLLIGREEANRIPDRLLEAMSVGRQVFVLGPGESLVGRLIQEAGMGSCHADSASLSEGIGCWIESRAPSALVPAHGALDSYRADRVAARLADELEKEIRSRA